MELKHFVSNVNRKLKKNIISKGDEILVVERFSTKSFSLDVELGGGAPEGRIITLAGLDMDGKSAMSLKMAAGFLEKHPDKGVMWVDAEGSWDNEWAEHLGVDVDKVYVVRPEYAEQGYQIALEALQASDTGLVVIDSVAAMLPKAEAEGDMEDQQVALQARLHKRFLRKANKWLLDCERDVVPTIIAINQMTTNIGGYGNPEMEGGGKGLRYYPSVKILLRKGELFDGKKTYKSVTQNDEGVEVVAQAIRFYVEKNKTAPPKRRGHFWFYFDHLDSVRKKGSIDRLEEIIRYAIKYDIVKRRDPKGSMYDYVDPDTGELHSIKGSASVAEFIRDNEKVKKHIEEAVFARANKAHEDEEVSKDDEADEPKPERAIDLEDDFFGDLTVDEGDDVTEGDESSEGVGSATSAA